jgi:hypothetical protein
MSTPTKSQANAASTATQTAIGTAAFNQFISDINQLIATAETQGLFQVNINMAPNVDPEEVFNYFTGLGYTVSFVNTFNPANSPSNNPAQLFGQFLVDFFNNFNLSNPATVYRVVVAWN